ncbi:microtubule-associated protein tau isoform X2 [Nylanderia fulva]|uniref:microtubule-associated protein tau isoform X2 n=1 Tax=Nylanderia fulva TaxID=613905 RepID=UPI0010FB8363|nr:microtubule-associated protein tau isoform X2 [Nylanderia fulva]
MDSQETANSMAEPASGHEKPMVKPNVPLPPQGFQARPQGPPPSPRNSINNGPIGAPRPGQPLRRLDSRSSLGPSPGQFVQLRPYGPPRPPGNTFPPRSPQPGQLPPQNPLHPPNQRFISPGIRGPPPPGIGGQRPPFIGNQQAYQAQLQQQQQQQQQQQLRFQRPDIPPENEPRRSSQESVFPRPLLRNDSLLTLQRQQFLSNEELKQPPRPRIVIEKMADINETNVDKPEDHVQKKRSDVRENGENDDDDDVVMDSEKSPRHHQDVSEGLTNGSKSPLVPKQPISRPGTATIENASKYHDKASKDDVASTISQSRPSSGLSKEERRDEEKLSRSPSSKEPNIIKSLKGEIDVVKNLAEDFVRDEVSLLEDSMSHKSPRPPSVETFELIEEIQKPLSPYSGIAFEQSLKTPPKSSDNSRSATPSSQNAEQAASRPLSRISDRSRSSTSAHLDATENAERSKTPDKSRSGTPAGMEPRGNTEQESRSRASTPLLQPSPSPNAEKEPRLTPTKSPDKSRSSTPAGIESSGKASTEDRDKSGEDTLQVRESSRPGSSLGSRGKDDKSPKSPRSPTMPKDQGKLSTPDSARTPTASSGGVKGFDDEEQRSLSSGGSPRASNSPKSAAKQTEGEKKKKTSFVETADKKSVEIADPIPTATSPSKAKTPRPQTPARLEDEKSAKKKAIQNGSESQAANGSTAGSPTKSPSKSAKSLPRTPDTPSSTAQDKKKVPMNKVQVGAAPSPNLKTVRSKIGSLDNASYKPGGGKVKIENRKLDFGSKAQPKIAAKNDKYMPSGGDKKIAQVKLQWNAKSKVGSLDNATYKPGGGDKKIETVKLDFKDKAKPKVGSKDNAKHIPGGGTVKIPMQKLDIKAESKIGSLDNVKHKPGGGDKKIFNDRDYLRQTSSNVESLNGSGSQSPVPSGAITTGKNGLPASDENLNQEC